MKNIIPSDVSRRRIDKRIDRLLEEIGSPEPPLHLEIVEDALKLDVKYFQQGDRDFLDRIIHRMRVGAIQSFLRPMIVVDAIKKFNLRALCAPDEKRILIDGSLPPLKHRWLKAHEITHQLLPWHHELLLGDTDITPTASCRETMEAEANYGGGQLIFLRDRFREEVRSVDLSLNNLKKIGKQFDNTFTSTLWRAVEMMGDERPMLAVISSHPHPSRRLLDTAETAPCKHFIQSRAFAARFSKVTESGIFNAISSYCGRQSAGPLGTSDVVIPDDNGDLQVFHFETFFNRYDALTLGTHVGQKPVMVSLAA